MSLTTYIGSNVKLPIMENNDRRDERIFIGESFSERQCIVDVKHHQFSTKYAYEVTYDWWGIVLSPFEDIQMYEKCIKALNELCHIMDHYLQKGEYFELYSCWVGEESERRYMDLTLPLHNFYEKDMKILERTLVTFKK